MAANIITPIGIAFAIESIAFAIKSSAFALLPSAFALYVSQLRSARPCALEKSANIVLWFWLLIIQVIEYV